MRERKREGERERENVKGVLKERPFPLTLSVSLLKLAWQKGTSIHSSNLFLFLLITCYIRLAHHIMKRCYVLLMKKLRSFY